MVSVILSEAEHPLLSVTWTVYVSVTATVAVGLAVLVALNPVPGDQE